jgi:hypothetical protein
MKTNKILIISAVIIAILLVGIFIGQTINKNKYPIVEYGQDINSAQPVTINDNKPVPKPTPISTVNPKIAVLKNIMKDKYFKSTKTIRECTAATKTYFISGTNSYSDGEDGYYSLSGTFLGACGGFRDINSGYVPPEVCKIQFDQCHVILEPRDGDQPEIDFYNLK